MEIAECNNSVVFPGIGLGAVLCRAERVTDRMLVAAVEAVAELSPALGDPTAPLLPGVEVVRHVSVRVARKVIQAAAAEGVVTEEDVPEDDGELGRVDPRADVEPGLPAAEARADGGRQPTGPRRAEGGWDGRACRELVMRSQGVGYRFYRVVCHPALRRIGPLLSLPRSGSFHPFGLPASLSCLAAQNPRVARLISGNSRKGRCGPRSRLLGRSLHVTCRSWISCPKGTETRRVARRRRVWSCAGGRACWCQVPTGCAEHSGRP